MVEVLIDGHRLRVFESGPGSAGVVLLLHGFPDDHRLWDAQVKVLASAGWRAIAPDLLGFGGSDKPHDVRCYALGRQAAMVCRTMDQLGCPQFCVVGHDFGAALAWRLAAQAPARVQKLVVLSVGSPAVFFPAGGMEQRRRAWYQLFFLHRPAAEEGLQADDWALLRAMLSDEPAAVQQRYIAALSQPGALTASLSWYRANTVPAMFAQTSCQNAPLVQCPTLGIWSSGDEALTEAQMVASECQVAAGRWQYEQIQGCNHWIPRNAAQQLNSLLLDFLPNRTAAPPVARL